MEEPTQPLQHEDCCLGVRQEPGQQHRVHGLGLGQQPAKEAAQPLPRHAMHALGSHVVAPDGQILPPPTDPWSVVWGWLDHPEAVARALIRQSNKLGKGRLVKPLNHRYCLLNCSLPASQSCWSRVAST